jgi:endogenous inhibitor of DNA gyrase (YacG/DUF329 family)
MEKLKCPKCEKEFNPSTGRRPKRFCSTKCRISYHNSHKEREYVKRETFEAVVAENESLKKKLSNLSPNKPITGGKTKGEGLVSKSAKVPKIERKQGNAGKIGAKS